MSTRATSTDPGSKSAAEIEREVQQSRTELEQTLDAIQERLSPGELVDRALGYVRGGRGTDFARNLGASIAANPIPIALMGVGLAWMMMSSGERRTRGEWGYRDEELDPFEDHYGGLAEEDMSYLGPEAEAGGRYGEEAGGRYGEHVAAAGHAARDRIGEAGERARDAAAHARDRVRDAGAHARDRLRDAGAHARDRFGRARAGVAARSHDVQDGARHLRAQASRYGERARQGFLHSLDEQPLVLGAIGLAIGAALGAALPPTETEDELMGDTRDEALRRATEIGREQAGKVRGAAGAVAAAARDEAGRQGLMPEGSGQAGREGSGQTGREGSGQTDREGSGQTGREGSGQAGPEGSGQAGEGKSFPGGEGAPRESRSATFAADTPLPADPKANLDRP